MDDHSDKPVRHMRERNTTIITTYGVAKLDGQGHVTNLHELKNDEGHGITADHLLKLPSFESADAFRAPETQVNKTGQDPRPVGIPEEQLYALIEELSRNTGNLNSEGYLDMATLNNALKEKGWPAITGTERKNITDRYRKPQEPAKPATPSVPSQQQATPENPPAT